MKVSDLIDWLNHNAELDALVVVKLWSMDADFGYESPLRPDQLSHSLINKEVLIQVDA